MARTDAELVQATLAGDPAAFEQIVRRYQRLVFKIVYHYLGVRDEVEDLAQDVFLKVYRGLETFDSERSFKAWISRIAANTCLDHLRRMRTRKVEVFSDLAPEEEDRLHDFFERYVHAPSMTDGDVEQLFALLGKLMDRLAPKDKMAFVLRELEGLSYAELAETLETSEVAVRIRVSRSKKKLQDELTRLLEKEKV